MKYILISIIFITNLYSISIVENKNWPIGETLLTFLEKEKLPLSLYYELDREDKIVVSEIIAGLNFSIMRDRDKIKQVLIPLGDDIQIHILQKNNKYNLELIPIDYSKHTKIFVVSITRSPYQDIIENSDNYMLAQEFINTFKKSINFKRDIRVGDKVAIIYEEKIRLGRFWGNPLIKASLVQTRGRDNYIYLNTDGRYYNSKAKEIESFLLTKPVRYTRISSRFTLRRWHPILRRYRPHFGIDYAAPRGRVVRAAGNGRVVFVGRKGGYGNVIKIAHDEGYLTLYAHLKGFKRGIRKGKYVKKRQIIGYVGTTGRSTGPHLHFGLYKNNRPINPNSMIKITKSKLKGKSKKAFLTLANGYKKQIEDKIMQYEATGK
jgi:murein DD-endopeptidase MepM/ murein hydrolase activator NlpD